MMNHIKAKFRKAETDGWELFVQVLEAHLVNKENNPKDFVLIHAAGVPKPDGEFVWVHHAE